MGGKLTKDYEQEADRLSADAVKKSKNEKDLKKNLGKNLQHDFSKVNISHENLNGNVAYTQGGDIHLDNSVNTDSSFGRQVLGHEMVHAAQQSGQGGKVSVAPASVPQFFPDRNKDGDLKLKNKFAYRKDKEYQAMYGAYNAYIKDKNNPRKKIEAIRTATEYMMHNTDVTNQANMGEKQVHQGRMQVAEQIVHDLTIDKNITDKANANVDILNNRGVVSPKLLASKGEETARRNMENGVNELHSVINNEDKKFSTTLQTVTAGTLGGHLGNGGTANLTGVTLTNSSGVTPKYDEKGNVTGNSININADLSRGSDVGATALHELTHLANDRVYGNDMTMSIAKNVIGENKSERDARYQEKASRRFKNLNDFNKAGNLELNTMFYAGISDKFKAQYAGNNLVGAMIGSGSMNTEQINAVTAGVSSGTIKDRNGLNDVIAAQNIANPERFERGQLGANVDNYMDLLRINEEMNRNKKGNLTTLIEYDSKLTDYLFRLETSGNFNPKDPAHRRLKAMVMEAYTDREMQRIQNEIDKENELTNRPMDVKHKSQADMDVEMDNLIKKQLQDGKEELLDDPKTQEHIMKRWKEKGSSIASGQDFTNGYTGNGMMAFRGNAAWVTNYGMLLKRTVTKGGKSVTEIVMEDIATSDNDKDGDRAWNAIQAAMNIGDDIRDNEEMQRFLREGAEIFDGNETASPIVKQAFLQNFLLNRVYTPELTITAKKTGDTGMEDISTMLLENSVLPKENGTAPQFKEDSENARLNPAMRMMRHEQDINRAIGEALWMEKAEAPRRGFRRRRG
ncbi:MAG: DUF4157 domain-containing protein [Lachnospiraceae bacterium]|nr:DUF4157 domain-containing protein [Lachnospiraceae bacterium]